MSTQTPDDTTLVRGLSLTAATSINIANMIGTGVFLKARVMTCNVNRPSLVIIVWIVGGLLSLAGALAYAELMTLLPRAGGEYVILREAYGPRWGFLYGWTYFFIAKTASQAALAVGFAIFFNTLTGDTLSHQVFPLIGGFRIPFTYLQLTALATLAFVTLINCAAVNISGHIASVLTAIKILLVIAIGAGAFFFIKGDWAHFALSNIGGACEGVSPAARGGMAGFGAAMLGALWAYDGWNNVAPLAGEIRNPQRNIPLAFIGGTLLVAALYVFVNIAYYYALTPTEIASIPAASYVARDVAMRFLGSFALSLFAVALMFSSFGALHTSVLAGARVPYAMSRDRLFFDSLARVSTRTHVPVRALVVGGVWSGALVLLFAGNYDTLTDYAIFALWLFYGLTIASIFVFRRRLPDAPRPYRAWGYPVIPALFLLVTAWLLINTLQTSFWQTIIGIFLILLGLPVYWYWLRRNQAIG